MAATDSRRKSLMTKAKEMNDTDLLSRIGLGETHIDMVPHDIC